MVVRVGRPVALPRPLSGFIGRDRDVATICALLRQRATRLVTLVGPGGVGKTRIAMQAAQSVQHDFDGAHFASLAAVTDPALVASSIATALGVKETGDQSLTDQLVGTIGERRLLLVLDNFEQLLRAAGLVADLLLACPSLAVLATSRSPLRVTGEHLVPIPPMSLPDERTVEAVAAADAIRLFVARAQAAGPAFDLTPTNVEAVVEICRRLDGLPLAIELAAARIAVLPPDALLARLDPTLPMLRGGPADAPARQQTMRDTIAWSYDLLSPDEQALFRRLGVFAGGFTLEAAEAVSRRTVDASSAVRPTAASILEGIASLVDKSLLHRIDGAVGPRFGMLETVREFAVERLEASGEETAVRWVHATFVLAVAEAVSERLWHSVEPAALDRLAAEHDNARVALAWLDQTKDQATCLRLAVAFGWFWYIRGFEREARSWFERTLIPEAAVAPIDRAWALMWLSDFAVRRADWARAAALAERSAELWWSLGAHESGLAAALICLGSAESFRGEWIKAEAALAEALAIGQAMDHAHFIGVSLDNLAELALIRGDRAKAEQLLEEALAVQRGTGRPWGLPFTLILLGTIEHDRDNLVMALERYREALSVASDAGEVAFLVSALIGIASVAVRADAAETAVRLLGAAATLRETGGTSVALAKRGDDYRATEAARLVLADAAFEAAWAAGCALTVTDAVREAFQVDPPVPARTRKPARPFGLTARECEVLRLIVAGMTDQQIADALDIGHRTVTTHVSSILAKLGVANRTGAATVAMANGIR